MTFIDDIAIPQVQFALNLTGKPVVFTREVSGEYDPDTGVSVTTTQFTTKCLIDDSRRAQGGSAEKVYDRTIFLPPSDSFTPDIGDKVNIDGRTWDVSDIKFHYSGEQVAIYECNVE